MIGTRIIENPVKAQLQAATDSLTALRMLGREGRKFIAARHTPYRTNRQPSSAYIVLAIRALRRCHYLAQQFKVVEIDRSCTRNVKTKDDKIVEFPLIFHSPIPAKRVTTLEFRDPEHANEREPWRYVLRCSAMTPLPTLEATHQISKHRDKFDHLEVWWVPNDILVERIEKPDPILVGAVVVPNHETMYFELCRWIDESVESGWWSREAY